MDVSEAWVVLVLLFVVFVAFATAIMWATLSLLFSVPSGVVVALVFVVALFTMRMITR